MNETIEIRAHTNKLGNPCKERQGLLIIKNPDKGTYILKCISCGKGGLFPEIPSKVQAIISLAREQTTSPSD